MNKKRLFTKSLVAAAITLAASQQALAAGFQLNAQSATGLGRAFAGDAVIADNASAMSRNAAAMSLFKSPAISLGINAIDTDIEVKGAEYTALTQRGPQTFSLDDQQVGDISYAPNLYYIHPVNEKWTVGASIYSNFGTKTEFSDDYAANEYGGMTDVKSVNFGLSASYRIDQQWSVGGGLDVIYGEGKLQRSGLGMGDNLLDIDADHGRQYRESQIVEIANPDRLLEEVVEEVVSGTGFGDTGEIVDGAKGRGRADADLRQLDAEVADLGGERSHQVAFLAGDLVGLGSVA